MNRWLSRILPFLLTGALLNLAVAWAISTFVIAAGDTATRNAIQTKSGERVPYMLWQTPGIDLIRWDLELDDGGSTPSTLKSPPAWSGVAARPAFNGGHADFEVKIRAESGAGWPMRSMRWCYAVKDPPKIAVYEPRFGAIPLPDHPSMPPWHIGRRRAIPLIPVWPGFAVDAAVYAGACFLAVGIPNFIQRRRRRSRSLCETCAYPVGTSPVCTECGRPVSARAGVKA